MPEDRNQKSQLPDAARREAVTSFKELFELEDVQLFELRDCEVVMAHA